MMQPTGDKSPRIFIIDIREVLDSKMRLRSMYPLYKVYPLQEIIQSILSTSPYEDHGEFFWMMLDERLSRENDSTQFDLNTIGIFYESLTDHVDGYIRNKTPMFLDPSEYVFERWIDPTTIVMQRDENLCSCNSPLPNVNGKFRYFPAV